MGLCEIEIGEPVVFTAEECAEMDAFIREHQRMIFALCYRMTNSREDAEDLCQETFIQACKHYRTFRGQCRLSTWLYRIALNQSLNWRSRAQRRQRLQAKFVSEDTVDGITPSTASHEVNAALMRLKPKQRAAIVLTVYDELSHAEAARLLGCSEATVSWRVFIARRQLRKWLKHLAAGGMP